MAGPICCMTILFYLFDKRNASKAYHAFVVLLAAIFLYFTQSKSSMLSLSIAILAGVAISMFDYAGAYKALVRRVILASLTFPLFLVLAFEKLQSHFDREAFSGRMRIWSTMLLYARDHFDRRGFRFLLALGQGQPGFSTDRGMGGRTLRGGHNSYFDLLVTIGFPGLVLRWRCWCSIRSGACWLQTRFPRPAVRCCFRSSFSASSTALPNPSFWTARWTRPFDHDLRADRSGACDKHHELGLSQAPVNCSAAGQILKRCCLGKGKRGW
jgi:hypothetical protein